MVNEKSLHAVYIVNEDGLNKVFTDIKETLASQNDATLIYFSAENDFVYSRELNILRKRYPSQFVIYKIRESVLDKPSSFQELLEAIINANTKEKLIFVLSGDEELNHIVSNCLWFLSIDKNQITRC